MSWSIVVCLTAFWVLTWLVRRNGHSLGLPIAYLFALLLIHVPGAIAHAFNNVSSTQGTALSDPFYTELGIRFTAIGAVCFVVGVWIAGWPRMRAATSRPVNRFNFWWFCLGAGWFVTYALSFLGKVPSLGAAIEKGGAVWMLGVLLGLRDAVRRGQPLWIAVWLAALGVYPVLMLLLGGFLSYGSTAIIIVLSVLAVSTRSPLRTTAGLVIVAILSFNGFLAYFQHRNEIRGAVWGGAPIDQRIDAAMSMVRDFAWFDPTDERQLISLDQRLNQNFFVGLAAARLENEEVDYLHGRSFWEGLLSLVPRAVWPDKPVYGGSPQIVSEVTGLSLPETTSWGVGNVMEFQINFGTPGVVGGFLALGWLLGRLDREAARAEALGDLGRLFLFFLPAVALIQPNGSLVEITGGPAAALVAAFGWKWAWEFGSRQFAGPSRGVAFVPYEDAHRGA